MAYLRNYRYDSRFKCLWIEIRDDKLSLSWFARIIIQVDTKGLSFDFNPKVYNRCLPFILEEVRKAYEFLDNPHWKSIVKGYQAIQSVEELPF